MTYHRRLRSWIPSLDMDPYPNKKYWCKGADQTKEMPVMGYTNEVTVSLSTQLEVDR